MVARLEVMAVLLWGHVGAALVCVGADQICGGALASVPGPDARTSLLSRSLELPPVPVLLQVYILLSSSSSCMIALMHDCMSLDHALTMLPCCKTTQGTTWY